MAKKVVQVVDFAPEFDFLVFGIFCSYRDHRLCHEINKRLEFQLQRQADVEVKLDRKGSAGLFSNFFFISENEEEIYLVSNKSANGLLIPEQKAIDYFLVIKGCSRYMVPEEMISSMKSIHIISSVIEIDPTGLKSAENFLSLEPVNESEYEKPKNPPVI